MAGCSSPHIDIYIICRGTIIPFYVHWSRGYGYRRRAVAFFKMEIGCHGLGVLAMAVSLTNSHGHPDDGQSVAPPTALDPCPPGSQFSPSPHCLRPSSRAEGNSVSDTVGDPRSNASLAPCGPDTHLQARFNPVSVRKVSAECTKRTQKCPRLDAPGASFCP